MYFMLENSAKFKFENFTLLPSIQKLKNPQLEKTFCMQHALYCPLYGTHDKLSMRTKKRSHDPKMSLDLGHYAKILLKYT